MSENIYVNAYILPEGRAAAWGTISEERVIITDGFYPKIYIFNNCGIQTGEQLSVRPYKAINYDFESNRYIALGCGCNRRLYILDCTLREIAAIDIRGAYGNIFDASIYNLEPYKGNLIVTFNHSVEIFSLTGEHLDNIYRDESRLFNRSRSISDGVITHYTENTADFLTAKQANNTLGNYTLPAFLRLKSFTEIANCDVYGFFTNKYSYNYILPIYENRTIGTNALYDPISIINDVGDCCSG